MATHEEKPAAIEGTLDVAGVPAKWVVLPYADRVFITITQLDTFGTMIAASVEVFPDGSREHHLKTLLGNREEDVLSLTSRRLADAVYSSGGRSLLLAIGLKPACETAEAAIGICEFFESRKPWGR